MFVYKLFKLRGIDRVFSNKILMMEGECSSHRSNEDCELSGIQLTWKRVNVGGNLPPRDGHCACSCGGKIFIFGGVVQTTVDGAHRESNDLLMFDPGRYINCHSVAAVVKHKHLEKQLLVGEN